MKFDIIIGNPPYQLEDNGNDRSLKPIYQHFVDIAKKINPECISLIIPCRWYSGGKGLDSFRHSMLNDKRIYKLVDYDNYKDIFTEVVLTGGVCYFIWKKNYNGPCQVINYNKEKSIIKTRFLNEYDFFVRQNNSLEIVNKIQHQYNKFLHERISSRNPFGLCSNYVPKENGIPCQFIRKIGIKYALEKDIIDTNNYLDKWKFLIPIIPISGNTDFSKPIDIYNEKNTKIIKPGECCTESWIVAGAFSSWGG